MTKFTRSIATTMAASLMFFGYQGAAVAGVAVGDTVTCTSLGGFGCSAGSAVVGAGPEFIIDNNYMSMDFTTNQLTVLALRNFTLGLTVIQFGNTTDPFTGFTFASQNGFIGLDAADITMVGNQLQIDFRGTCFACGGQITTGDTLVITFAQNAVPEPATWALLIVGFGGVGAAMRRRKGELLAA